MRRADAYAYLWCFGLDKYGLVDPVDSEVDDYIYNRWSIICTSRWIFIFEMLARRLLCFKLSNDDMPRFARDAGRARCLCKVFHGGRWKVKLFYFFPLLCLYSSLIFVFFVYVCDYGFQIMENKVSDDEEDDEVRRHGRGVEIMRPWFLTTFSRRTTGIIQWCGYGPHQTSRTHDQGPVSLTFWDLE